MILNRIIPPSSEPITLADIESQVRFLDLSAESLAIDRFISAVRENCETLTKRALITQTWEVVLDEFPSGRNPINIPLPPLQFINSIKYIDVNEVEQTLNPLSYRVISSTSPKCQPAYVIPAYGLSWPVALNDEAVITVNFTCGYGPIGGGSEADNVPNSIKQWLCLNVANLYEHRETIQVGNRLTMIEIPTLGDGLINDYRVIRL